MRFVLYAVQFGTAALLFLFSALASWYEGSELLRDRWEWNYSARFTKLLHGADSIKDASDISQLDFFVYAAKHAPASIILMAVSLAYITALAAYLLIKTYFKRKRSLHTL
ncbi:YjdJ family protein [Bacillus sp. z60-18]|uniref:YjdJ family protein n=1 Tax=unclassified Bacillus (in: firmicutes) TaxID=185979 RepID=UPI002409DCD5|nr:YjdJ family protein [Bacillus sp. HSf4]WFA04965.1 YjdJ family protein [Bacillus sp. HSf4]